MPGTVHPDASAAVLKPSSPAFLMHTSQHRNVPPELWGVLVLGRGAGMGAVSTAPGRRVAEGRHDRMA